MNFSFLAAAICEKDEIWGFKQSIQVRYMVQNHHMNTIHQSRVVMPCNLWEPFSPVLSVLKFCGSWSSQILSGCLSISLYNENTVVLCSLSKMRLSYGRPHCEFEDLILVLGMVLCWRLFTKIHLPRLSNDGWKGWWRNTKFHNMTSLPFFTANIGHFTKQVELQSSWLHGTLAIK
jgi:hypothetical protein